MIDAPLYPWRGRPRPLQIAVVRNRCRFSICEGMRKRGVFFCCVVDDIVTELSLRPWMGFSWLTSIHPSVGALHLMNVFSSSSSNSGTFAPAKQKSHEMAETPRRRRGRREVMTRPSNPCELSRRATARRTAAQSRPWCPVCCGRLPSLRQERRG